jgi:hypothetical protein
MYQRQRYFQKFFEDQEEILADMCPTCRDLRQEEMVSRNAKTACEVTQALKLSLADFEQKLGKAIPEYSAPDQVDHQNETSSEEDASSSEDEVDGDNPKKKKRVETALTRVGRDVRQVAKRLAAHLRDPAFKLEHGRFATHGLFGLHEDPVDDDMRDYDSDDYDAALELDLKIDDHHPHFIIEDQDQSKFQIGGKRDRREVHKGGGCVEGHHVLLKAADDADVFIVGDVMQRYPENPLSQIEVHIRGNAANKILGSYQLGWVNAAGDCYYKEAKSHPSHRAWMEVVWIQSIITWSSDWDFLKDYKLPAKAKTRVIKTGAISWDGKELPPREPPSRKKKSKKKTRKV